MRPVASNGDPSALASATAKKASSSASGSKGPAQRDLIGWVKRREHATATMSQAASTAPCSGWRAPVGVQNENSILIAAITLIYL